MLVFAIDHEPNQLNILHEAIREAAPGAEIRDFPDLSSALDRNERDGAPDAVFTEVNPPGTEELGFVRELKTAFPGTRVILIADTEELAARAYELHTEGYVIRPFSAERIREETDLIAASAAIRSNRRLYVRCFGYFEIFLDHDPLAFSRKKTKELFAFLISRNGSACSADDLIPILYEDSGSENTKKAKQNIRNLIFDLMETLKQIGQEEILIRRGSSIAIHPERLDCDYYRMLAGDRTVLHLYHGEFMEQYSWAENIKGSIEFDIDKTE